MIRSCQIGNTLPITLSSLSIGPRAMAAPKWWRAAAAPDWAQLDAQIAEASRLINQFPGRRQVAAAGRIDVKAIYVARAVRAALPRVRAKICESQCHEQADGREVCDELYCKATVQMQPRPRSIRP